MLERHVGGHGEQKAGLGLGLSFFFFLSAMALSPQRRSGASFGFRGSKTVLFGY